MVIALLLVQAASTVMVPVLVLLPRVMASTEGWRKFHSAWVSIANPPGPIKVMAPAATIFSMLRVLILLTLLVSARPPALIFMLNVAPLRVLPKVISAAELSVVLALKVTASLKVCVPVVVISPDKEVVPLLLVVRFLMPVKSAPIVVVPPKLSVKSWFAPVTPPEKTEVVPVRMVLASRVTASL